MTATDPDTGNSGTCAPFGEALAVTPRVAELHGFVAFPRMISIRLGEWVLRWEPWPRGRVRKRANSALAIGDPGRPLDEAVEQVQRFYGNRDRQVIAQVVADSPVHQDLLGRGWASVRGGDAHFLLAEPSAVLRSCADSGAPLEVDDDGRHVTVSGPRERGEASLDDGWLYIYGLYVEPAARGRGRARVVMGDLLRWGLAHDATVVWLHVETDNAPALRLYERLGFQRHHTLSYLSPAAHDM